MDHKAAVECSVPHVHVAIQTASKQSIAQGEKLIKFTTYTYTRVRTHKYTQNRSYLFHHLNELE